MIVALSLGRAGYIGPEAAAMFFTANAILALSWMDLKDAANAVSRRLSRREAQSA